MEYNLVNEKIVAIQKQNYGSRTSYNDIKKYFDCNRLYIEKIRLRNGFMEEV